MDRIHSQRTDRDNQRDQEIIPLIHPCIRLSKDYDGDVGLALAQETAQRYEIF